MNQNKLSSIAGYVRATTKPRCDLYMSLLLYEGRMLFGLL